MSSSSNHTSSAARRIIVDDTDAQVVYTGMWQVDTLGSQDTIGNFGKTFRGTLHGVVGALASFSMIYQGSSARVMGTVNARNQSGNIDPTWECFVDGKSIGRSDIINFPENNWPLCEYNSSTPGTHNLSLYVISDRRPFWLDYVEYVPFPGISTNNSYIMVQDSDPAIHYGPTWKEASAIDSEVFAHWTRTQGDSVNVTFIGTGIQWYSWIPKEMPRDPSIGAYTVDGEAPVSFILPGIPREVSASIYNQKIFETPDLSLGSHTITVSYLGSSTPLTLDYLIIRNQTAGSGVQTVDTPIAPGTTDLAPSSSSSSSRLSTGVIIGVVFGCLFTIVFLVSAFVMCRRWYRKRNLPTIQPLPGYIPPTEPRAPLDFDTMPRRYSVELEERHQSHNGPFHMRRRSRIFNPEVRSTITSLDLNPPPMIHAPPSTSNPETASIVTDPRGSFMDQEALPETRYSQADPYSAGYPYANLEMSNYEQLVVATKAEKAKRKSTRTHRSHR